MSGILVLLATATIAATFNVQTAKASFGDIASYQARNDKQNDHSQQNAQGKGSGIGNGLDANSGGGGPDASHVKNGLFGATVSGIAKNP